MRFYTTDGTGNYIRADWWTFAAAALIAVLWGAIAVLGGLGLYAFPIRRGLGLEHAGILGVLGGVGFALTLIIELLPYLLERWRGTSSPLPSRPAHGGFRFTFLAAAVGPSLAASAGSAVLFVLGISL